MSDPANLTLRERILAAQDRPFEDVEVPEWGAVVRVLSMSGLDRDRWEAEMLERNKRPAAERLANVRASLVARCSADPATGERLFADADIDALGAKAARALDRVFAVASRLNGLSDADAEQLAKN